MADHELGSITWHDGLNAWEGSIKLTSDVPFELLVFSRAPETSDRAITTRAREAVARLRGLEGACRQYAANQLLGIFHQEWSEGERLTAEEFARQLVPATVEVHEAGYTEVHFGDGGLFCGHGVGVRIRADGTFQEAVVEG